MPVVAVRGLGQAGNPEARHAGVRPSNSRVPGPAQGRSPDVLARVRCLFEHRGLVAEMVRREFAVWYHGSALGVLWTQLYPLLCFATYYVLFNVLIVVENHATAFYLLTGLVLWHFCSMAVQLS